MEQTLERHPRLTGTRVVTGDGLPWIVSAEYVASGHPVVDLTALRSGRTERRAAVPVTELLDTDGRGR